MRYEIKRVGRSGNKNTFYVIRDGKGVYVLDSDATVKMFPLAEACVTAVGSMCVNTDDVRIGGLSMHISTLIREVGQHGGEFFLGECFGMTEQVYAKVAKEKGSTIDEVKKRANHVAVTY